MKVGWRGLVAAEKKTINFSESREPLPPTRVYRFSPPNGQGSGWGSFALPRIRLTFGNCGGKLNVSVLFYVFVLSSRAMAQDKSDAKVNPKERAK